MSDVKKMYDFDLPEELIAQEPARPRDAAKLLVYDLKSGIITDSVFSEVNNFLPNETTLVLNNSKVDECRWLFDGGKTEIFVVEKLDTKTIRAMVRPGRKFKVGGSLKLTEWLVAEVVAADSEGVRTLKLNVQHNDLRLNEFEHVPLPPYIKQNDRLADEYQTVYAKPAGSLAAPTAGLHFTEELLSEISKNHEIAEVTLNVGLGTFAKLTEENIKTGRLHAEEASIDQVAADKLNRAKHLTAVGTTTVRTLESFSAMPRQFVPQKSATDIFIRPGHVFKNVEAIVTNFHLPSTSLLMLVAAFIADKKSLSEQESAAELIRIYQHAIDNKYRFYSFGDAMLLV